MANRPAVTRRQLLKIFAGSLLGSSLGLGAACTHKKFLNPDENILLSGGSSHDDGGTTHMLVVINLVQQEKKRIATSFLPHGIIIDPNNKNRVLCFEKNGERACEIDLATQHVTQEFTSTGGKLFSGHAVFSADGKQLYTIESLPGESLPDQHTDNVTGGNPGSYTIRRGDTFEPVQSLPTLGLDPHDCQLLENNTLVISNTGLSASGFHQPSLVYIDLNTGKLVKRVRLDNTQLNCGHFRQTESGELVIASAPVATARAGLNGGVSLKNHASELLTPTEPDVVIQRMQGEALGISIQTQRQLAAITHPEANLLTFWSVAGQTLIKAIGIEDPRGITQSIDGRFFIVSYGQQNPSIATIAVDGLTPQKDSIIQATLASGEHMVNWSRTLRTIMPHNIY